MAKARFKASPRGALLFKAEARTDFLTITSRQYGHMKARARKDLHDANLELPFTLEAYRKDVLSVLAQGKKDGAVECRYCHGFFVVSEISPDHALPLARGGGLGLDNLDYPCMNCNRAKGAMTVDEFLKLIDFLEREMPLARRDILGRLSKAISLAVAARRAFVRARDAQTKATSGAAPAAAQLKLEAPF
jgi:5-methylcytosine-specific restriction endonuclease McrA